MRSKCASIVAFGLFVTLGGCGAVDNGVTYLPKFFRQPAFEPEIDQPPDVDLIVRNNISAIFMASASPNNVSVSFPVPAKYVGWTTSVQATAPGVYRRALRTHTQPV